MNTIKLTGKESELMAAIMGPLFGGFVTREGNNFSFSGDVAGELEARAIDAKLLMEKLENAFAVAHEVECDTDND
jgi:hypothetical protein